MALPYANIEAIPDTNPPAVPALWNTRYSQVDGNFANLDGRVNPLESEISTARGGDNQLGDRLNGIDANVAGLNPDMQNMIVAVLKGAMNLSGMANKELIKTLNQRFQTGVATIYNRGIINGVIATKSADAARNLNLSAGKIFMHGQIVPIAEALNSASVPANNTSSDLDCYSYLYTGGGNLLHAVTALGATVPANGLSLYRITVPAGNTEITDQYLANVTMTDIRRVEPGYPLYYSTAPNAYIAIPFPFPTTADFSYAIDVDVLSFEGNGYQMGYVYPSGRLANGFSLNANGSIDAVSVRWTVRKLDL